MVWYIGRSDPVMRGVLLGFFFSRFCEEFEIGFGIGAGSSWVSGVMLLARLQKGLLLCLMNYVVIFIYEQAINDTFSFLILSKILEPVSINYQRR